jgi:uncharacterized lipoprotein
MRSSLKKALVVLSITSLLFLLSACSSSSSSSYNPKDYDRKYDSSEFGGARDVWDAINGK